MGFQTNWQSLKDHFSQAGEVEIASVLLKPDRTSKGCGMVDFKSHEEAVWAVQMLNASELDGRQIAVKLDVDGKFKNRPAPGTRPQMYQVTAQPKSQVNMAVLNSGVRAPAVRQNQSEALATLAHLAALPGAHQLDWPSIV